ncbi:YdcF family protein [Luteolibacter sp. LG18]|uniref:YdcF family protein n=1 Tax=Luteolibacter sp. LG18 TaxID=2819286 RepID=UPI002B285D7A|nr:hypothetical protein llg_00110 [Luteolibacter sp. LG18]
MKTPLLPPEIHRAAQTLWDYHQVGHRIEKADGILVFGSNDLRVASHAAALYHAGSGPWVLFSGARGRMTEHWAETEAEAMARVAVANGVPESSILLEPTATNTGENIHRSKALLADAGFHARSLVVVQKPYMERRTLAALEAQWQGVSFQVTSPPLSLDAYFTDELTPGLVLEAMTGDFQRILDYPALGFATPQPVTPEVMEAYRTLVEAGYGLPA